MISPFRFFWSKILPISYENYLSETEILEAFRKKLNEVISAITEIQVVFSDNLEETVTKIVNQNMNVFNKKLSDYEKEVDSKISDLEKTLAVFDVKYTGDINELNGKIDLIKMDITKIENDISIIEENIRVVYDYMLNLLPKFNELIAFNRVYSDKQLELAKVQWVKQLSKIYLNIKKWVINYFTNLSNETIYVYDGHGVMVTLQDYINTLENRLNETHGLTAWQFDNMGLSVDEFENLNLTAWEFDNWGLNGVDYLDGITKLQDMYGFDSINPVPSVYSAVCHPIRAGDIDRLSYTVEEVDNINNNFDCFLIDKWGYYIYTTGADLDTLEKNVIFEKIPLEGEKIISEFTTTVETKCFDSEFRGVFLNGDLSHYHPTTDYTISNFGSEYTLINGGYKISVLNNRLNQLKNNVIDSDISIQKISDLAFKNNNLSFVNLAVVVDNLPHDLTVKISGNHYSRFCVTGGISSSRFDSLNLTAEYFDGLNLTALIFDTDGI